MNVAALLLNVVFTGIPLKYVLVAKSFFLLHFFLYPPQMHFFNADN